MSARHVDTNVVLRYLIGDQPAHAAAAAALFARVEAGEERIAISQTVFVEAAHVMRSPAIYGLTRAEAAKQLRTIARLPGVAIERRQDLLHALDVFEATNISFGDALIACAAIREGEGLYSWDRGLDRIDGMHRIDPIRATNST